MNGLMQLKLTMKQTLRVGEEEAEATTLPITLLFLCRGLLCCSVSTLLTPPLGLDQSSPKVKDSRQSR